MSSALRKERVVMRLLRSEPWTSSARAGSATGVTAAASSLERGRP